MTAIIADDSPVMLEVSRRILVKLGYTIVAACYDGGETWKAIQEHNPDVALVDYIMPNMTGSQIADAVKSQGLNTFVVLATSMGQKGTLGAHPHVIKPLAAPFVEMALSGAYGVH